RVIRQHSGLSCQGVVLPGAGCARTRWSDRADPAGAACGDTHPGGTPAPDTAGPLPAWRLARRAATREERHAAYRSVAEARAGITGIGRFGRRYRRTGRPRRRHRAPERRTVGRALPDFAPACGIP